LELPRLANRDHDSRLLADRCLRQLERREAAVLAFELKRCRQPLGDTRPEPLWIGDVGERCDELSRRTTSKLQHRADLVPLLHRPIVEPLRGLLIVQIPPWTRRIGRGAGALLAVEAERNRTVSIVGASPLNALHQP